jgi:hypothetical protein
MALNMLMIVAESEHRERIESALVDHEALGFTEIPTVYGSGRTGPRLGSRAFPGQSSIIFTVGEEEKVSELIDAIHRSCAECRDGMRMVLWKVDRML